MWSTVSFRRLAPLHLAALVYSCAHFHIVIYSRSLRTSQPHHLHHHRLRPVWSLSSFSTGSRGRRKPGEEREKRCGDQTTAVPTSFSAVFFFFREKLPKSPAAQCREARPNCWGARLQLSELRLDVVSKRQRVQRERAAELSVPSHKPLQMSSCKERRREDDFAVTHFDLRVSVESWQWWQTEVYKETHSGSVTRDWVHS